MKAMKHLLSACVVLIAAPTSGTAKAEAALKYGSPIAVSRALAIIDQGMKTSAARGLTMAFAIVEPSGELVAFARMEDAPYASTALAQQKARSSARLRLATSELEARVQNGRSVLLSSDEVLAVGGGVPIVVDGQVIGALGVSGGSAAQDAEVAASLLLPR